LRVKSTAESRLACECALYKVFLGMITVYSVTKGLILFSEDLDFDDFSSTPFFIFIAVGFLPIMVCSYYMSLRNLCAPDIVVFEQSIMIVLP